MGIQAAVFQNSATDASEAAALQHGPWTCKRLLSRGLAASERFLHQAGFEQGPWLSVAFGAGITAWFALPTPIWWAAFLGIALAFNATGSASFSARQAYPYLLRATTAVVLIMAGGLSVAWVRSELVGAVPIERPISGVFEGRLLGIEPQPARGRDRLLLAMRDPTTDSGRAIKIRVNRARDGSHLRLQTGDVIRFQGRLMPPAPPMLPGAYNFARTAWFSGIAATGSVLGPVLHVERGRPAGRLAALRQKLTDHVRSRIGESASGLAAAFVTGDRGGIVAVDDQAMRDSGLAHLLSISGLHVSALVGAVYLLVLRLAALFPWLALRVRLPVLAAGGGALAGIGYTLISGAEVPTVRSCVGALLVLIALALGREPLSLRMLAVAAFCVMMLWPEAVMGPSFQMSFGAVLALVAISGAAPVRRFMAPRDEALIIRALRSLGLLLVTGIVIDLALMPIGLFHFHRAGVYGALANVVAIPLTTFIVMPLLAGALLLDLFGAGTPLWWLAAHAIEALLALAHTFASLPGAVNLLPATGNGAFLVFILGGLWLGLWSGRVRWLGLPPALGGAFLLAMSPSADILVPGDGRQVGVVEEGGQRLFLLRNSDGGFVRDNLMEFTGMEAEPLSLARWPNARCNQDFCTFTIVREGRNWRLLLSRGRDTVPERALAAACERSDIVIADRRLPRSCRPRWLKADRRSLKQSGGLAIHLGKQRIDTVAQTQGEHGWWVRRPDALDRPRRP
ncbi:ComEC/Rec2 family competence protein [Novosphingobium panipatense]|uniref:ComEC/Rec2 family competence protein n=1 Tax=Novosphingobium TaxID=165696 RepID=UPI000CDB2B77|nr:ComEC/Rec2 family competence protein [Novosphingobium sp. HII-3]